MQLNAVVTLKNTQIAEQQRLLKEQAQQIAELVQKVQTLEQESSDQKVTGIFLTHSPLLVARGAWFVSKLIPSQILFTTVL